MSKQGHAKHRHADATSSAPRAGPARPRASGHAEGHPPAATTGPDSASRKEHEPAPSHEEIAARAYELWGGRGRTDGGDWQDWFEAERQLRAGETAPGPRADVLQEVSRN